MTVAPILLQTNVYFSFESVTALNWAGKDKKLFLLRKQTQPTGVH